MEIDDVREKVISNIEVLIKEKQLLLGYLVYILNLIDWTYSGATLKIYAKGQISSYIIKMLERSGKEHEINELILEYLNSLEFPEEFAFSDKKKMIIDFIKMLDGSYFKRAKSYAQITESYYALIQRHIMVEQCLEIKDNNNYIDEKKYQLMKDLLQNK